MHIGFGGNVRRIGIERNPSTGVSVVENHICLFLGVKGWSGIQNTIEILQLLSVGSNRKGVIQASHIILYGAKFAVVSMFESNVLFSTKFETGVHTALKKIIHYNFMTT